MSHLNNNISLKNNSKVDNNQVNLSPKTSPINLFTLNDTSFNTSYESPAKKKKFLNDTSDFVYNKKYMFCKKCSINVNNLQEKILEEAKIYPNKAFLVELISLTITQDLKIFFFTRAYYGTLSNVLSKIEPFPMHLSYFVKIAYSIANALDFLHSKEISHGFITTDHCLIDENGYARLCGLGNLYQGTLVSRYRWIDNEKTKYFAPEIIQSKNNKELINPFSVDMYAYGVILYICLTGHSPFTKNGLKPAFNDQKLRQETLNWPQNTLFTINENRILIPKNANLTNLTIDSLKPKNIMLEASKTVDKLLNKNPAIRVRAGAMVYSSWLQQSIQYVKKFPPMNSLYF